VSAVTAVWLRLRMVAWSVALPVLKRVLPLRMLARLMWREPEGPRRPEREAAVVNTARKIYRFRPSRSRHNCLERSLLAYRFLAEAGADPVLVVGVANPNAKVLGHAWLSVDGEPVDETAHSLEDFTPVVSFGTRGIVTPPPGPDARGKHADTTG
jgi:hypothetical protein